LHIAGCTLVSGLEKPTYFPWIRKRGDNI
jgi:hypothetical protein